MTKHEEGFNTNLSKWLQLIVKTLTSWYIKYFMIKRIKTLENKVDANKGSHTNTTHASKSGQNYGNTSMPKYYSDNYVSINNKGAVHGTFCGFNRNFKIQQNQSKE